jgi:hypothetical protein
MIMKEIVNDVLELHAESILKWKSSNVGFFYEDFLRLVEENHAYNFKLWNAEDRARREDMGYEFVYHAKREIDFCNQQRNNKMECMDEWLYKQLLPSKLTDCKFNSETPGMIIDRLSILSLKLYHMKEQSIRSDVDKLHQEKCLHKTYIITEQLKQLSLCLTEFLVDIQNKKRTFKVYHQFKMYNDPELNPELYAV